VLFRSTLTEGRVTIGSGTLYDLLEQFLSAGVIQETETAGRRRSYLITDKGREMLDREYRRLRSQTEDYDRVLREEAQE